MGRDPDSKWARWLALSRQDGPGSTFDTCSSSSPASLSSASPNIGNNKPLRPRSSATSYFALLSTNKNGSIDGRSFANNKQHGNVSGLMSRNMDSSWVAWFTERWQQGQLADACDRVIQEKAHSSDQSPLDSNKTQLSFENQRLPTQKNSIAQDPEKGAVSNTPLTTASVISSSAGISSTWPSPSSNFLNADIDSLDAFTELLPNFDSTFPFDPTNAQANGAEGSNDMTEFDDADLVWLEEQHEFPPNISDESRIQSPSNKRGREGYHGNYTNDYQNQLIDLTNKRQKIFH